MVFANYRELVRPVDAEKWFGITPELVQVAKKAHADQGKEQDCGVSGYGGGLEDWLG